MSVTREARHLAGHDIGKTITHKTTTGTLWGITHHTFGTHQLTIAFLDIGPDPTGASRILYLQSADHVTITGTPSPLGDTPTYVIFDETAINTPPPISVTDLYDRQGHTADIAYIDEIHETSTP